MLQESMIQMQIEKGIEAMQIKAKYIYILYIYNYIQACVNIYTQLSSQYCDTHAIW